jgi:site-specific DNA recombinase
VRFERENISSMSGDGELLLTILASFAQEESRSMSENIKWAIKKGFEKGELHSLSRAFGDEWDGSKYRIVPDEAEAVRLIFEQYLTGISTLQLPKLLNEKGVVGINGNSLTRASIKDILQNEIYIGNLVLQKSYSPKIRKRTLNYGELPKYQVEEAHEPIISKELFQEVQNARVERGKNASNKNKQITCFTGKVQCGKCGSKCIRNPIAHSKTTFREYYERWTCDGQRKHKMAYCDLKSLNEDELRKATVVLLRDKGNYEVRFIQEVDEVILFDDKAIFDLKDGRKLEWQRE